MNTNVIRIAYSANDFAVESLDHPAWSSAEEAAAGHYWSGVPAPAGRHFTGRLLWSETALYVRFDASQREPLFIRENPDTSKKIIGLWEHDVCELFIAPDKGRPDRYYEFEIAPTGEWLDLIVDWSCDEPRDWDYVSGMQAFARIESDRVIMAIKVPWSGFDRVPEAGDVWLGNIFRQVGSGETRGFLAWSPTMTETPQFHVPQRFGKFQFRR